MNHGRAFLAAALLAFLAHGAAEGQNDWLKGEFQPVKRTQDVKAKAGLIVPPVPSGPVIDGVLDDTEWKRAAKISKFTHGASDIRRHTEVLLLADMENLYVGFRCHEAEMDRIRTFVKPSKKRDLPVWDDDSVELYVDPTGEAGKHYQFLMSAVGALYYAEGGGLESKWEADFQAKAHVDKEFWSAEFAIPFQILGLDRGNPSYSVNMQFSRTATPGNIERTSWRPNWNDPKSFGPVIIGRQGVEPTIEELSLGNFCLGTNTLRVAVRNFPKGTYEARLQLADESAPRVLKFGGGYGKVELQYDLAAQNRRVNAAVMLSRTDTQPAQVLADIRRDFYVPGALAVSFRNAHLAEGGSGRMWVRALMGDAVPPRLKAIVLDAQGKPVRSMDLPGVPGGAATSWFTLDAKGLAPGPHFVRIESDRPRASATAKFWVERVEVPERDAVPLFVDEPIGRDWKSFPVTVGVPFPRARLDSAERIRVLDATGREVPSQIKATSTWNPDGRDIRWLLVDFLADSTREAGNAYRLEYGRAVTRAPVGNPIRVTETNDRVTVDTGAIRFDIDRGTGSILKEVRLGRRVIIAGDAAGVYLQNQARKVFSSAWDRDAPEVVEERGPIRAVVRQTGWYAARDGERLCRYDIRIQAFAGQPYLKILHTWIMTHDSRKVQFGDMSIRFPLADQVRRCAFGTDDAYENPGYEAGLGDNERVILVQEDSDRFKISVWRDGEEKVVQRGEQGGGWVGVWTRRARVLAHLRDMWQQYPAELEVGPNMLAVHFWPEHGFSYEHHERPDRYGVHRWPYADGAFMDLQPREYVEKVMTKDSEKIKSYDRINALGMSKTQEIWLDFREASEGSAETQEQARKYEQPLAARADAQWISDTRVFRPFVPADEAGVPRVERAIRARWDGQTYLQDRCHDYGWMHYGDRHSQSIPIGPTAKFRRLHRYWLVSDYRCGMEPWLLWVRSGERTYRRWAEVISRHVMDADIIHWTGEKVTPPRRKGQFYPMSFAHYCSMVASMSLHNDPIGFNMMYYYLTGYQRSLDVLTASGARELKDVDLSRGTMYRGIAVTGHNQLDMHRITWDEAYWDNAFKAINTGLDAMVAKTYLDYTYSYEWLHDIEDFTGDSRLKAAAVNIADNLIGRPLGTMSSYPALYCFGQAYALTGDPKYIAWGKGRMELDTACINVSDDPERRGRLIDHDNIHLTRLFRQVPGFLHYMKKAEAKHGPIERRTQPIRFLYERGPVYLREDADRAFTIGLYLRCISNNVATGFVRVTAPDGTVALERPALPTERQGQERVIELTVPADGQTGTYRMDLRLPSMVGGLITYWGIQRSDIRKIAYQIKKFTYQGNHVFFYVPKGTKSFRFRIDPRPGYIPVGQHVVLTPDGKEFKRLDVRNKDWAAIEPRPEDTGGLWCIILYDKGNFEMEGLPPFLYSDPAEFFIPEGPIVKQEPGFTDDPPSDVATRPESRWTFNDWESFNGMTARPGSRTFVPGRKGQTLAGNHYLGSPGVFNHKEGTVCFWFKPNWDKPDPKMSGRQLFAVHSLKGHKYNTECLATEKDQIYFFITDAKGARWNLHAKVRGGPDAPWRKGRWMHIGLAWKLATGDMVIYVNGKEAARQTVGPITQDANQIGQWIQLSGAGVDGITDDLFIARKFDPSLIMREITRAQ